MERRSSGVVLHISSLPGDYGIGSLGAQARGFADFLADGGQEYWQVLPLNPTGYGDSPYQSCCSAAGNPYFIDLGLLVQEGLLTKSDLAGESGASPDHVDYKKLYRTRWRTLRRAYERGGVALSKDIAAFREANKDWLPDYALFMAIRAHFGNVALRDWPDEEARKREPGVLRAYAEKLAADMGYYEFEQFLFERQWDALKAYAGGRGVKVIGDVPIYVSEDSVEVWAHPELFQLDGELRPSAVAGVPPDAYSASGQFWGNPLYDWAYHESTGYAWWIWRLRRAHHFFDAIRIDHFRGFHTYWSIPAGAKDASAGKWKRGPAMKIINAVRAALPDCEIIAEDLGDLDDGVRAFFKRTGYPGMCLLVHALDHEGESDYLPHNVGVNKVAYTTSHDSDTFVGLIDDSGEGVRKFATDYLRLRPDEGLSWGAIKAVWATPARLAMTTMQDILGLSNDARMNRPATLGGINWRWRVRKEALNKDVSALLRSITYTYRRGDWRKTKEKGKGKKST